MYRERVLFGLRRPPGLRQRPLLIQHSAFLRSRIIKGLGARLDFPHFLPRAARVRKIPSVKRRVNDGRISLSLSLYSLGKKIDAKKTRLASSRGHLLLAPLVAVLRRLGVAPRPELRTAEGEGAPQKRTSERANARAAARPEVDKKAPLHPRHCRRCSREREREGARLPPPPPPPLLASSWERSTGLKWLSVRGFDSLSFFFSLSPPALRGVPHAPARSG